MMRKEIVNEKKMPDWEVKMIKKVEESDNKPAKELLQKLIDYDADGAEMITDEKVEEFRVAIDALEDIQSSIRKSFHRKLKILVEGDGKKLAKWEIRFINEIESSDNEDAKEILRKIQAVEGNETEKNVEEIDHLIAYSEIPQEMKNDFERKAKILRNRIERSISDNFGSLIKHLRESKGYSLKDMQAATGISSSYINRIEKGERKAPSIQIIKQLALALDQDFVELLNIANPEDQSDELQTVEELLLSTNYLVSGERLNKESKEKLVDLINKVSQSEWGDNKHLEAMGIMEAIEQFKNTMKKK
jgi:transcriptional regulator with XRE-family HTH domain